MSLRRRLLLLMLLLAITILALILFPRRYVALIDGQIAYYTYKGKSCIVRALYDECYELDQYQNADPTQSEIAYIPQTDTYPMVYRDGELDTLLTEVAWPRYPVLWSPDGQRIAYSNEINRHDRRLCIANADGSAHECLETDIDLSYPGSWSPNSDQIAFTGYYNSQGGYSSIYLINIDGTNLRLLADPAFDPSWSPDGAKIAFAANTPDRNYPNYDIYVADIDGNNVVRLTSDHSDEVNPVWSPNGSQIAFLSDRENGSVAVNILSSDSVAKFSIYLMNADGSNVRTLLSPPFDSILYFVWH